MWVKLSPYNQENKHVLFAMAYQCLGTDQHKLHSGRAVSDFPLVPFQDASGMFQTNMNKKQTHSIK